MTEVEVFQLVFQFCRNAFLYNFRTMTSKIIAAMAESSQEGTDERM
jgi:hypothetical protein